MPVDAVLVRRRRMIAATHLSLVVDARRVVEVFGQKRTVVAAAAGRDPAPRSACRPAALSHAARSPRSAFRRGPPCATPAARFRRARPGAAQRRAHPWRRAAVHDAKINVDDNASMPGRADGHTPAAVRARCVRAGYITSRSMISAASTRRPGDGDHNLISSGGRPANFRRRRRHTKERDRSVRDHPDSSQVRGVLVNIFGGIVRCDIIAEGIGAVAEVGIRIPVVRLKAPMPNRALASSVDHHRRRRPEAAGWSRRCVGGPSVLVDRNTRVIARVSGAVTGRRLLTARCRWWRDAADHLLAGVRRATRCDRNEAS